MALASCAVACGPATSEDPSSQGVVLVRIVDGSSEIVHVRLADGAERAVTATPDREEAWPYWSSIAQRLVFQVASGGSGSDLVLWSPETGETPLTQTPRREERWPAWSPQAPRLVHAFWGGHPPSGIAVLDVQSGESRTLATSGRDDYFFRPSFSPDATHLVMQRRGEGRGSLLWVLSAGGKPRPLTTDPAWHDMKAFFSRDGRRIFFSRRPATGGPRDIMSIAIGGGELLRHGSLPASDDHSARPSPVRDEIAFVSNREGRPAVYLLELPDGAPRRLSPPGFAAFAPRWSPDGERVVVTATPAGSAAPALSRPESLKSARVLVLERDGTLVLDVPGHMPDWMAPWP